MSWTDRIPLDLVSVPPERTTFSILKVRDFKDVPQVGFSADLY